MCGKILQLDAGNIKRVRYKDSGVDIDRADAIKDKIAKLIPKTSYVIEGIGPFAAITKLPECDVIVSACDGVGTKLKVAYEARKFEGVGVDVVAMCANDVLAMGGEPFIFLDYIALDKLDEELITRVIEGIAKGCEDAGCALVGGETAQMPSFYTDAFELVGFCIGTAKKENLPKPDGIKPGDIVVGLPSSGIHSNGFSLIREAILTKFRLDYILPELNKPLGEVLLEPTRIYVKTVGKIVGKIGYPKVSAHITGGGIPGNLARVIPEGLKATIKAVFRNPIFDFIKKEAKVDRDEMFRIFNMGVGFMLVYPEEKASDIEGIDEAKIVGVINEGGPKVVID